MIELELNRLLQDAKADEALREALLQTRGTDNPVDDFCALAQARGYDIQTGELFALGLSTAGTTPTSSFSPRCSGHKPQYTSAFSRMSGACFPLDIIRQFL